MKNKTVLLLILAFFVNLVIVITFKFECPWNKYLGIDCAGCGATRMLLSILRLDFYQAFRFNPFMFVLFTIVLLYFIYVLFCKTLKKSYFIPGFKTAIVLIILLVVFMILRNMDGFGYLKPTIVR